MFLNAFMTGQALLLSSLRILRPRNVRSEGAEQPRNVIDSWPQTRQFHEHGRVHEQSASMFSSRQQAHQRIVRVRDHGKAPTSPKQVLARNGHCSRTRSDLEHSITADSASSGIVPELRQVENAPRRSIAVSISSLTCFPVHVHTIPYYVHV